MRKMSEDSVDLDASYIDGVKVQVDRRLGSGAARSIPARGPYVRRIGR